MLRYTCFSLLSFLLSFQLAWLCVRRVVCHGCLLLVASVFVRCQLPAVDLLAAHPWSLRRWCCILKCGECMLTFSLGLVHLTGFLQFQCFGSVAECVKVVAQAAFSSRCCSISRVWFCCVHCNFWHCCSLHLLFVFVPSHCWLTLL